MKFTVAAAELRCAEITRLSDAIVSHLEIMRRMTPEAFRGLIAGMLERFGHQIVMGPTAPDLMTTKDGKKFITDCAAPTDIVPTGTRKLVRLHDAVIAANAAWGFYHDVGLHRCCPASWRVIDRGH
jgi:hypothetical protein